MSDIAIQTEGLVSFFKNLGKLSAEVERELSSNLLKNPGRALKITSNNATAAARRNPKAALASLPEVLTFYHRGKGLCLGKFVWFYTI